MSQVTHAVLYLPPDADLVLTLRKTGELRHFIMRDVEYIGGVVGCNLLFVMRILSTEVVFDNSSFLPAFDILSCRHLVGRDRASSMLDAWRNSRESRQRRGKSSTSRPIRMYCWLISVCHVYSPPVIVPRVRGQVSIIRV